MIRREHAPSSPAPSETGCEQPSAGPAQGRLGWTDDSPNDLECDSVTAADTREDLLGDTRQGGGEGAADEPLVAQQATDRPSASEPSAHADAPADDDQDSPHDDPAEDGGHAGEPQVLHDPVAPHESRPAELLDFDLAAVSTAEIQAELDRRQRQAHKLMSERARLLSRMAQLDREIARLSGGEDEAPRMTPLPTPVRRDLSDLSLGDAIARLYSIGDEFSPSDVEERLVENGYQSRVANLRTAVTQVLSKELRFKRMARGVYLRTG